jgi:hypothetical protein
MFSIASTGSIPEATLKRQADTSLSLQIDTVARCVVASLFYFELNLLLQWHNSRYVLNGHIRRIMQRDKAALEALWSKLSSNRGKFLADMWRRTSYFDFAALFLHTR